MLQINVDFSFMYPYIIIRPFNTDLIFKAADILLPRNRNPHPNNEAGLFLFCFKIYLDS